VQERVRPVRGRVFLIGTANDCDLVLGDLTFPEAYAYLFVHGTKVTIRRLGSGPELIVCGERVETAELYHGDRLVLGPFELRVVIAESEASRRRASGSSGDDEVSLLLNEIRQGLTEDSRAGGWSETGEPCAKHSAVAYEPKWSRFPS
jgi:hypothetical protein